MQQKTNLMSSLIGEELSMTRSSIPRISAGVFVAGRPRRRRRLSEEDPRSVQISERRESSNKPAPVRRIEDRPKVEKHVVCNLSRFLFSREKHSAKIKTLIHPKTYISQCKGNASYGRID